MIDAGTLYWVYMRARSWEKISAEEIVLQLESNDRRGLSLEEVAKRHSIYGKNILEEGTHATIFSKLAKQFKSPLVSILLVAGVATLILHEYVDSIVIFIALLINVVVGFFQEERANRAFEKLNRSQERFATVVREGRKHLVPVEELVPGDLVEIESGQYIPADIRLISEKELSVNESALTGEWVGVAKDTAVIDRDVPLAERRNMAWRGTLVSGGYGMGIVVATGSDTQVGIIARELGTVEEHVTPLQQNIRAIARFISYVIAGSIAVIFVLGLLRGESIGEMLLISIAIAVAAIPSGLPAAVTVVLAIGMEKILRRGGLVRNLLAAETLGATTIILTDKTGTLTEAKMKLVNIYTLATLRGSTTHESELWTEDEKEALRAAVLASDAYVEEQKKEGHGDTEEERELIVRGRPIEKAIVLAGLDVGISKTHLFDTREQVDYLQFESSRRFGGSLNKGEKAKTNCFYITGAPETLLECTPFVYKNGKRQKLTTSIRDEFVKMQNKQSSNGMRFIGVAYKEVPWNKIPEKKVHADGGAELLEEATFLGFLVFEDPIRADVPEAIKEVQKAGAEVLMVTGDNPETARKIACDVGIACSKKDVRLGSDIEKAKDDEAVYALIQKTKIFARTLPSQKLRIARILKNKNEIVAMTGDGINDAPALRSANIGIAVGSGTEVAKEASDIILLNNSFSIIVAAIEEGRRIIDNLKKIMAYLLSTSFSEIFVIGGALAVGAPLPLLPAQILWANIIEEGLMSFSFAFERTTPGIMRRNPRESSVRNVMTPVLKQMIVIVSVVTGVFLTLLFFMLNWAGLPIEEIRTIMFVALSLDAIFFSFSLKSFDRPLWKIDLFSNRFLLFALATSILLLLAAITLPPLRLLLSLTVLTPLEVILLFFVGLFNLFTIEMVKYTLFVWRKRR